MSSEKETLEQELRELRRKIEAAGYQLEVMWADEYGGSQAVTLTAWDRVRLV